MINKTIAGIFTISLCFMIVFICGCVESDYSITSTKDEPSVILSHAYGISKISNTTYFIECHDYTICSELITDFSINHTIVELSSFDRDFYGKTSGYFVIVKDN